MVKEDRQIVFSEMKRHNRFSKKWVIADVLQLFCYKLKSQKFQAYVYRLKHNAVTKYLSRYYVPLLKNYNSDSDNETDKSESRDIFVCWFQGEDAAPKLVKKCIASVRNAAGNHKVHIITYDNISDYVDIPDYIIKKHNEGKITHAHFSDYLRVSLLEKYGGLWIDSTVFCDSPIPDWVFERDFFTCKFAPNITGSNIAKGRWTSFIIGGKKNYITFKFIKELFDTYWKTEEAIIEYFFIDFALNIAYENFEIFKKDLDNLPVNNQHIFDYEISMRNALPAKDWKFHDATFFSKLSFHRDYKTVDENNNVTVYGDFIND